MPISRAVKWAPSPLVMGRVRRGRRIGFKSMNLFSTRNYVISGVTRDSTGAALGNVVLDLFYTSTNQLAATIQSDAGGNYSFSVGPNLTCYIVAYLSGSPDVSGTTVNTLVGA